MVEFLQGSLRVWRYIQGFVAETQRGILKRGFGLLFEGFGDYFIVSLITRIWHQGKRGFDAFYCARSS